MRGRGREREREGEGEEGLTVIGFVSKNPPDSSVWMCTSGGMMLKRAHGKVGTGVWHRSRSVVELKGERGGRRRRGGRGEA